MTPSKESIFIARVFERHGARPDVLLFRNETAGAWVGQKRGVTNGGDVVLRNARPISVGLCVGSSDLVGILLDGGRWVCMEVKVTGTTTKKQSKWLKRMEEMGALVAVVKNMADVDAVLGEPPA